MKYLKNKIELLRNDKKLCTIFFLHLLLIGLPVLQRGT